MSETGIETPFGVGEDDPFLDTELILQQLLENPNLVQHVCRTEENGCETVVGYFRVSFAPRQQRQVLHIPFTPPLKVVPQVEAHVTDHQDVRIRITDCQKFGIRSEIILAQANDKPRKLLVEIIATESN